MNSTLQPIIDTLIPLLPGWLELPESYVGLLKGATHKYIKRVPKSGGGYRYFYHVGHGGGVHSEDHFVPGASFRFEGGHYHIKSAEGGKLVIEHDETKERKTVSKSELRQMLGAHHESAIKAHREKVAGMLAEARANKASPKQIAKLEARAKAVGVETQGKRKAPPSKPKEGATRDEHLAAHMAASDHHEFESDQLINEAQNREEDTGKRATALREKAKEHDRAFTAHRNAMSALRHAKSDSDAATARSESEKAWAATHGLASQTGGGAKAEGVALKSKGPPSKPKAKVAGSVPKAESKPNAPKSAADAKGPEVGILDWDATRQQAEQFISASNATERLINSTVKSLPVDLKQSAWRTLSQHEANQRFGRESARRPSFAKFGEHKAAMVRAWDSIGAAFQGVARFSDSDIALMIRDGQRGPR